MKKTRLLTAGAAVAAAASIAAMPAASANNISGWNSAGSWKYTDSTDRFCVWADPGKSISARLIPSSSDRGPEPVITARNGGVTCTDLQNAYEDTRYTAKIAATGERIAYYGFHS